MREWRRPGSRRSGEVSPAASCPRRGAPTWRAARRCRRRRLWAPRSRCAAAHLAAVFRHHGSSSVTRSGSLPCLPPRHDDAEHPARAACPAVRVPARAVCLLTTSGSTRNSMPSTLSASAAVSPTASMAGESTRMMSRFRPSASMIAGETVGRRRSRRDWVSAGRLAARTAGRSHRAAWPVRGSRPCRPTLRPTDTACSDSMSCDCPVTTVDTPSSVRDTEVLVHARPTQICVDHDDLPAA